MNLCRVSGTGMTTTNPRDPTISSAAVAAQEQRHCQPGVLAKTARTPGYHLVAAIAALRLLRFARYAVGSVSAGVPVKWRCASAAVPIKPPIPIDSTAVDGTIIIAPFSFRPS